MIEKINHTEEILEELRKNGNSKLLDTPEDIAAIQAMNENLEKDHQEFLFKQIESERLAGECYVCSSQPLISC